MTEISFTKALNNYFRGRLWIRVIFQVSVFLNTETENSTQLDEITH